MQKIYISITLFFLFIISGCGGTPSPMDKLNVEEYKIVMGRKDFQKKQNADINFIIDKKTDNALVELSDAHIKIMFKINLDRNSKYIQTIRLIQRNTLNLNRLLIPKKDYYYDSVSNAVYVSFVIPYIYLLDNKIYFNLQMNIADKNMKLHQRVLVLLIKTKPMRDNGEKYMSFQYEKDFKGNNIDPYIKSMIKKELQHTNVKRFDTSYKKRNIVIFEE